jgi:hypothetical protein
MAHKMDDHSFECPVCGGMYVLCKREMRFNEFICECCASWSDDLHFIYFQQEAEQAAHDYWLTTHNS